jgi:hypothetical protein
VPPVVGADVVVLAGDVHIKNRGLQWIFDQKFEIPVLYVLVKMGTSVLFLYLHYI